MPILSFTDSNTEEYYKTGRIKKGVSWASLSKIVKRKLDMLNYAHRLEDLKAPPGNQLEALQRELKGWHSIRVNDQWRIVFKWTPEGARDVRVMDYHS